ncbi:hypothetical protein KXS07_32810 [Inquilinus limosus]|uniref:hypothetical protein n=1 Tax=Inquilinus limosus TaxID=171674 RepID=UPI003F17AA9D
MQEIAPALFGGAVILLVAGTFWLVIAGIRGKIRRVAARRPVAGPDGSVDIPLAAGFRGIRGIPWIAVSHSDVGPRLRLHPDGIEFKVVRTERRAYSEVSSVDIRTAVATVNVVIEFRTSLRSFAGNVASLATAAEAVDILAAKGCPVTPRAEAVRRSHRAGPPPADAG